MRRENVSFGDLQNYTTLKHIRIAMVFLRRFGDLQNYTTLKLRYLVLVYY